MSTQPQRKSSRRLFLVGSSSVLTTSLLLAGCRVPYPNGSPMQPPPLGSVVDEANRVQEENAERAKLIVYAHEFELNKPIKQVKNPWTLPIGEVEVGKRTARGFRLNEYGTEHIQRIAKYLHNNLDQTIVVERSETSKRWNTLYQYPVHYNAHLDQQRRQVVVAALESLGIQNANDLVIIARAFPEGMHSQESVQSYNTLWQSGGMNGSSSNSSSNSSGGSNR